MAVRNAVRYDGEMGYDHREDYKRGIKRYPLFAGDCGPIVTLFPMRKFTGWVTLEVDQYGRPWIVFEQTENIYTQDPPIAVHLQDFVPKPLPAPPPPPLRLPPPDDDDEADCVIRSR